jgi:hypothetical protein
MICVVAALWADNLLLKGHVRVTFKLDEMSYTTRTSESDRQDLASSKEIFNSELVEMSVSQPLV